MFCQNSVLLTIVCCFVVISSAVLIDDLSDNQNETAGMNRILESGGTSFAMNDTHFCGAWTDF